MDIAEKIYNAWLKTIEDGIHTGDIFSDAYSRQKVGTAAFADAVIERLGQQPEHFRPLKTDTAHPAQLRISEYQRPAVKKELVGVDVFVDWPGNDPKEIGDKLVRDAQGIMTLKMITNRGVKVYPGGFPETFCTDHWRCRFVAEQDGVQLKDLKYHAVPYERVLQLLTKMSEDGVDVIKTENLYTFDGKRGFSLGQGE